MSGRPADHPMVDSEDASAGAPAGRRILLAEDNPINALLATKQLRYLGYETVVAPNGRLVVAQWQAVPFDLILMDCHMPEMDGYEATRAIRRFDREHPERRRAIIVALTAGTREADREACAAAGMDDYIGKPAEIADLDRVLRRWLGPPGQTGSERNTRDA